ncbi:hypothetical protein D3C87_1183590 [compost metagenome]
MHVIEGAVALRIVGDRAREQLIPTGEPGEFALNVDGKLGTMAQVGTVVGLSHQLGATLVQEQRDLLGFEQARQLMVQRRQLFAQLAFATFGGLLNVQAPFLQLQADRYGGDVFFLEFIAETGELIDPGFDAKHIAALIRYLKAALPAVVAHIGHDFAVPGFITFSPPAHAHCQLVVTVGKHFAGDHDVLPHHGLDRKLATVEGRHGVFNGNARQQQRLRQWHVRVVAQFSRFFSRHRASLLTPHGRSCVWMSSRRASRPAMNSLRFRATATAKSS